MKQKNQPMPNGRQAPRLGKQDSLPADLRRPKQDICICCQQDHNPTPDGEGVKACINCFWRRCQISKQEKVSEGLEFDKEFDTVWFNAVSPSDRYDTIKALFKDRIQKARLETIQEIDDELCGLDGMGEFYVKSYSTEEIKDLLESLKSATKEDL